MHRNIVNGTKQSGGERTDTISIAMATYNGERFLQEQLQSLASQTRPPDELVVCDDLSSDRTVGIVESFASSAPFPVRIERNDVNLGFVRNFEKAISACSGRIVFLCDQDDFWFPGKIESVVSLMLSGGWLAVTNDQIIADGSLKPTAFTKLGNVRSAGLPDRAMITGCCTAIRSELGRIALPVPEACRSHDGWINRVADALDARIMLDEPLQLYRRHESNVSNWQMSRAEKPSRFGDVFRYGLADAREGWALEAAVVSELRDRLLLNEALLISLGFSKPEIGNRVSAIEAKVCALGRRARAVSRHRLQRWPEVLKMWRDGDYRNFDGIKSAIKDIVR